jgi:hypothetical protein
MFFAQLWIAWKPAFLFVVAIASRDFELLGLDFVPNSFLIYIKRLLFISAAIALPFSLLTSCNDATSQDDSMHGRAHAAKADAPALPPAGKTPRPADAKLYILSPANGATVEKTFTIQFGLKGMGVAPAGIYMSPDAPTGHHHLLVDVDKVDLAMPVMKDETHIHFGGGQTETALALAPGEHTLQLLLGDHAHMPHDPPLVSEKITVTVK